MEENIITFVKNTHYTKFTKHYKNIKHIGEKISMRVKTHLENKKETILRYQEKLKTLQREMLSDGMVEAWEDMKKITKKLENEVERLDRAIKISEEDKDVM